MYLIQFRGSFITSSAALIQALHLCAIQFKSVSVTGKETTLASNVARFKAIFINNRDRIIISPAHKLINNIQRKLDLITVATAGSTFAYTVRVVDWIPRLRGCIIELV